MRCVTKLIHGCAFVDCFGILSTNCLGKFCVCCPMFNHWLLELCLDWSFFGKLISMSCWLVLSVRADSEWIYFERLFDHWSQRQVLRTNDTARSQGQIKRKEFHCLKWMSCSSGLTPLNRRAVMATLLRSSRDWHGNDHSFIRLGSVAFVFCGNMHARKFGRCSCWEGDST